MKTIGIIGGMSFESTITYYKTINQANLQYTLLKLYFTKIKRSE